MNRKYLNQIEEVLEEMLEDQKHIIRNELIFEDPYYKDEGPIESIEKLIVIIKQSPYLTYKFLNIIEEQFPKYINKNI